MKFIAKPTANGEDTIISMRLTVDRQKVERSLGLIGKKDDWIAEEERFSECLQYNCSINRQLSEVRGRVEECYQIVHRKGVTPTAKLIRDEFYGVKDTRIAPTLLDFIEGHILTLSKLPEDEFSPGTLVQYKAMQKRLTAFLESINEEHLLLRNLTRKIIYEFQEYLTTTPSPETGRPIKASSAGKYLSKLRAIINVSIQKEIGPVRNPFNGVKIARAVAKVQPLTWEEIEKIMNADLSGTNGLEKARDLFCWSLFTGLRFSESASMRKEDVYIENGRYRMIIRSKKSREVFDRPLINEAVQLYNELIEKYDGEYLLGRLSNQRTNSNLKILADLVKIKRPINHHLARHSFATTVLMDRGTEIKFVSHMLMHRKVATTEQVYAKITRELENRAIDEINERTALRKVS
ncbi:MAG: site-specific integrase [Flavobacteriales bacterium]|nr:site-specific integrase [Flavobacteriales bacterium]